LTDGRVLVTMCGFRIEAKRGRLGASFGGSMRPKMGILALLAMFSVLGGVSPSAAPDDVSVVLELSQDYYYEGDPILIRLSVRNSGPATVNNPVTLRLLQGLKVRKAGSTQLRPAKSGEINEPNRPDRLQPESCYGSLIDISGMYPQTLEPGHYELLWEGNGLQSRLLSVRVVPAYDPEADYFGEIVTSLGTVRMDLLEKDSPIAVKAFVDLAQSGYYDGLIINEVRQDQLIAGGNPAPGRTGLIFPAEQSSLPLVEGTVVLKPTDAAPPSNGPGFMILLAAQPAWVGQVTVLGRVVQGMETVTGLSRVPNTGGESVPPFQPVTPIRIKNILISKKKPAVSAILPGQTESQDG
jgi:cyclophilin family peptidyl-prolyl cis-trans isomerase